MHHARGSGNPRGPLEERLRALIFGRGGCRPALCKVFQRGGWLGKDSGLFCLESKSDVPMGKRRPRPCPDGERAAQPRLRAAILEVFA